MTTIQPGLLTYPTPTPVKPAPQPATWAVAPSALSWEGDQDPALAAAQSGGFFHGLVTGIEGFFGKLFHHQTAATSPIDPAAPVGGGASSPQDRLIAEAMRFKGLPYLWGGGHAPGTFSQPAPVDCSGLITQAARMAGISGLEGTAAGLQNQGRSVSLSNVQRGDLVFMGNPAHHVGIYLGNNQVLESPHTGDVVKICALNGYGWTSANRPNAYGNSAPTQAPPQPQTPPNNQAPSTPASSPGGTCTVQSGDTLSKIAARTLGDGNRWREIYDLNKGKLNDPNMIFPGQVLALPGAAAPAPKPAPTHAPKPDPKPVAATPAPKPAAPKPVALPKPAPASPTLASELAQIHVLENELALIQLRLKAMQASTL